MEITLDTIEVRILGSLMEKEMATPEYYPLSLNALIAACNQKTSRFPVLTLNEKDVLNALQSLKEKHLVYQSDASRVPKYWHDFFKKNNLIRREAALFCLLLLRGPQTAGELRSRTERLCSFENLEEVNQYLENLSEIGLVSKLPRQPGRKEQRFAHLLAGNPEGINEEVACQEPNLICQETVVDRIADLEDSVVYLKNEIEVLKNELSSLKKDRH
jgi:uncharacterized protein YceH (UPF0502 family)